MALKDIIGQEQALTFLTGCIKRNRLAHAYLFSGEDGIGKKLAAINLAKALNCQKYQNTLLVKSNEINKKSYHTSHTTHDEIDCCDECPSCMKIHKLSHPDVFFITGTNGQIKVDAIRKLIEALAYKAFEGKWKIVIIDEADTLNQSAVNAFLKTLEEPPEQSLIILISSRPELLPETILSRCHRIQFSPLPIKEMSKLLEEKLIEQKNQIHEKDAQVLSMLSGGRPGWVLSTSVLEKRDRLFAEFKTLVENMEEDIWGSRESMEEWFEWAHLWLRDIAVLKATGNPALLINQDREKEFRALLKKASLNDILKLAKTFYDIKEFLRFNLNKRVTLQYTHLLLKQTLGG
jgi:DNA polymerase-3 subunit delta'